MRIRAQRGQQLLVDVGRGRGRIYDVGRRRLSDEMALVTLSAAGYWGDVALPDAELRQAEAQIAAALPG